MAAGADIIHFDVMDNHYVPNLTFGPPVCAALHQHRPDVELDVHLMCEPVDRLIPDFAAAGARVISFHPEATRHLDRTIGLIEASGAKPGLAINPGTPLHHLDNVLDRLHVVLLMSVNPGFGGQAFIPYVLDKAREVKMRIEAGRHDVHIQIDGGIKADNIAQAAEAGVDTFVAGSAIFGQPDYKAVIDAMRGALAGTR